MMDLLHSQFQTLLEISETIASQRDLDQLFKDLAPRLHHVVQFDFANLILYEPTRGVMKSHVLETPDPAYACPPGECPMETPGGWVRETQQPWVATNLNSETRFPDVAQWLYSRGVLSLCVVPVTTALRKLGALAFGSRLEEPTRRSTSFSCSRSLGKSPLPWITRSILPKRNRCSSNSRKNAIG